MKILVTGGAGYIGSQMNIKLREAGHDICVLDNLSNSDRCAVKNFDFYHCDITNLQYLDSIFAEEEFDAVLHFAGLIDVAESIHKPALYYKNNVTGTLNILDCMVKYNVSHFLFSSTAAVYGTPETIPIKETHPTQPINPYGDSKLIIENALMDYQQAHGISYTCLRYFNAAGADIVNHLGECHEPETHLIPLVLQVASGRRDSIAIFGNDYDTTDGTCIRDYIHVSDLCDAHLLAMDHMINSKSCGHFNLGNGQGFSVQEVIEAAKEVSGKEITIEHAARRTGDPAILVADASKAKKILNWQPCRYQLHDIVTDAWEWEQVLAKR
jgi:UDP-glucose 4-epimerase